MQKIRTAVQLIWTALTNAYLAGFAKGTIFMGPTKSLCVPGLNCYSCPGALGACPIGAMQAVSTRRDYTVPFYAIGFVVAVGAVLGRGVCGFLCPFGLVQDLLNRIPFPKKVRDTFRGERFLRVWKYFVLAFLVLLLPMYAVDAYGLGEPWYCKWLCPSGTLMAGWPLVLAGKGLSSMIGAVFYWKSAILVTLLLLSLIVYRPFCRWLCPLGAMYGLLNPVSLVRYTVEEEKCVECGACRLACPMGIDVRHHPNSAECIRCGRCLSACDMDALHLINRRKSGRIQEKEVRL